MDALLGKIINAAGPSGREDPVRKIIQKEAGKYADKVWTDKFGNLIAHKKGKGPKIMLAAHMDEIGLMVKGIDNYGYLRFAPVGGVEPATLLGQKVEIISRRDKHICYGVLTTSELHEAYSIEKPISFDDLYIDVGLTKKEAKRKGIEVGVYALPVKDVFELGNKKIIAGKAMDDRVGCYIMIQVLKKIRNAAYDCYFVWTVQEEVGLYGAQTSTYSIDPDIGIAVETTNAMDAGEPKIVLGAGPVISMMDSEIIMNTKLNMMIEDLAKSIRIPVQREVVEEGTTDATRIMMSHEGVPSTVLSVAVRNLHSTISVIHLNDVILLEKLLLAFLKKKCDVSGICEI